MNCAQVVVLYIFRATCANFAENDCDPINVLQGVLLCLVPIPQTLKLWKVVTQYRQVHGCVCLQTLMVPWCRCKLGVRREHLPLCRFLAELLQFHGEFRKFCHLLGNICCLATSIYWLSATLE